jgi:hypothetical protein
MHSPIMGQGGTKYLGAGVLKVTVILTNCVHLWLYTITNIYIYIYIYIFISYYVFTTYTEPVPPRDFGVLKM